MLADEFDEDELLELIVASELEELVCAEEIAEDATLLSLDFADDMTSADELLLVATALLLASEVVDELAPVDAEDIADDETALDGTLLLNATLDSEELELLLILELLVFEELLPTLDEDMTTAFSHRILSRYNSTPFCLLGSTSSWKPA